MATYYLQYIAVAHQLHDVEPRLTDFIKAWFNKRCNKSVINRSVSSAAKKGKIYEEANTQFNLYLGQSL